MPRISQLENKIPTIANDAAILIDRDNGVPLKILGVDLKSELFSRLSPPVEYSFFDLAGDFRPAETRGEFYLFGKALLESYGYDLSIDNTKNGVPVLIETNEILSTIKGWMIHINDVVNSIKVLFEDGTESVYLENDSSPVLIKIFSWKAALANTEDWLRDIDIPGYPVRPTQMWNPNDVRNTWMDEKIAVVHNQIGTVSLTQADSSKQPDLHETTKGKIFLFSQGNSLDVTPFDLSTSVAWTLVFWVKPSNRDETLLGNSATSGNKIILKHSNSSILLIDSLNESTSISANIFNKKFHLVTITCSVEGFINIYIDKERKGMVAGASDFIGINSIGMSSFSGSLGFLFVENDIEASMAEVNHLYDRTVEKYEMNEEFNTPIMLGFSETEAYGFSETEVYAFEN